MAAKAGVAARLRPALTYLYGADLPLRIRAWDGSESGPRNAPVVVLRHRRALRRLVWCPNEVGLARAFVTGELTVDGDLFDALGAVQRMLDARTDMPRPTGGVWRDMLRLAIELGAVGLPPKPPAEEVRRLRGNRHSPFRDAAAVSHHYDVGNDFYERVLGPSMVYSCAYWTRPDDADYTLEDAQHDKIDLVCRKLGLQPGDRLLDVGCGWGSLAIHAAREYGVKVVGITLSREQADLAEKRVASAGLADQVEIRLQDYREVRDGPFDAISSIGMAEHVGTARYGEYASDLLALLRPGGRLLNHQITRRPGAAVNPDERTFIQAYVFPDGELLPVGTIVDVLEEAGFEVRDVESLREHYGRTLRRWVANLEDNWRECVRLSTVGRARVWQLYMTASALAFEAGRISVHQVLAIKAGPNGESGLPPTREAWLSVR